MPVRKSALPTSSAELRAVYDGRRHAKHTLFAGTNILQVTGGTEGPADDAWSGYKPQEAKGNEVMGLVLTTGIDTSKGDLISSILYPTKAAEGSSAVASARGTSPSHAHQCE